MAENDAIIEELMFRQDSLEANRKKDLERRFEMVMRMVRAETNGNRPDLEKRAQEMFLGTDSDIAIATANSSNDGRVLGNDKKNTNQSKDVVQTKQTDAVAITSPSIERPKTQNIEEKRPVTVKDKLENTVAAQKPAKKQVKSRRFRDLDGVQQGYYVVANVYKGGQYLHKFINTLEEKGIQADYIDNTNNGLKYVYLERYDTWEEAVAAHQSNFNGDYDGDLWIMNVDNRYSNEAYVENTQKIQEKSDKYNTDVLQQNVVVKDKVAQTRPKPKTQKINGVDEGYYIIANVFANPANANRFVRLLNSIGLNASYFINPENNWRYVYLKRHQSWNNALISYYTKLNDSYDDKMWIMRVTPNQIA